MKLEKSDEPETSTTDESMRASDEPKKNQYIKMDI